MTMEQFNELSEFEKLELAEKELYEEIGMRKFVYRRKVNAGTMTQDEMDLKIGIIEFALERIRAERDRVGIEIGVLMAFEEKA